MVKTTKYKLLSELQRKVYKEMCLKFWLQGGIKDVSEEAYKRAASMSTAECRDFLALLPVEEEEKPETKDDVLREMKAKYSVDELKRLSAGEVVTDHKVDTKSDHHKIGIMSDTHIGSIYTDNDMILQAFDTFEKEGCECVVHAGDLTEGMKRARLDRQVYEISEGCLGYRAMRDKAVEIFRKCKLPVYIISGNHDKFFQDDADIVEDVAQRLDNMTYLGYDTADLMIGNVKFRLFHGSDCFSNTRLMNLVYRQELYFQGVKVLLAGHVHKFEWKNIQHVHTFNIPCLQKTSTWMRSKNLYADVGYLVMEFDDVDGEIINLQTKYYPLA